MYRRSWLAMVWSLVMALLALSLAIRFFVATVLASWGLLMAVVLIVFGGASLASYRRVMR